MFRLGKISVSTVFTLALLGCAPNSPYQERGRPASINVAAPPRTDMLICRIRQDDKVFNDVLAFRIPVHDDQHQPPLDCTAMVAAEQAALKSTQTIPILDLGFIWLGAAAQWMQAHPEVHQCVEKVDAPNFVLSRFLGRADGTQGPTVVLLRNCEGRVFFVTNAQVPAGTAVCNEAHIPDCPTASRQVPRVAGLRENDARKIQ